MSLDERSKHLRRTIIEALEGGRRGHLGSSMSMVEILQVLYDSFLQFKPDEPSWKDRDRCILSKGHGCLALYAILADKKFFPREELRTFCLPTSRMGGHPERGKLPGVEASTGALGHGLSIGVGMALAAKINKQEYRVAVVTGDGEINEGSVWEAAMSAAKHKLSNLSVFVDYNKLQSYGPTAEVLDLEPLADKWRSFGFAVEEVDGHDVPALESLMARFPLDPQKPTAIICHTIKGKGFPFAEGNAEWHHKSGITSEEIKAMYECLI
jgi:transketolase